MPKKTYTDIPQQYPVCLFADCPQAATCLHFIVYEPLKKTETIMRLINPDKCSKDALCEYYRINAPLVYARGFTNFQKKMYPAQYQSFMALCINHWSRNPYFERRRGDRPLPPRKQEFILQALKKAGVTEEMKFDNYEENINWYD